MEKKLSQTDFRNKMPFNIKFCQKLFANYFNYAILPQIFNKPAFVKQIHTALKQNKTSITIDIPISLGSIAEMSKYMAYELMRCGQINSIEQLITMMPPVNLLTETSKTFVSEDHVLNIYGIKIDYKVALGTSPIILTNANPNMNNGPQNQLKFKITFDISPLANEVLYYRDNFVNLNYYIPFIKAIKNETRKTQVEDNTWVQYLDITTFFNLLVVNYIFTSKGSKVEDAYLKITELLNNTCQSLDLLDCFNEKAELITLDIPDKANMLDGNAQRSAIISFSSIG